tara:strand:+ start:1310 stop:1903 length:594 start_codon:yes stop_codon:yes gene_type:complete
MSQINVIKKAIPNSLTVFRCASSIILPLIIIFGGDIGAVLAPPLLILAALSDYFDGYFARKYKVISNFGKILDPIADKLLVIGILFALASDHMLSYHLSFIPALIIILREIFISGLRENMAQYKFSIIVSILAKWKTTIQLFACGSFLVWRSDPFFFQIQIIGWISQILLWVAAIITIVTGIEYILKTVLFLKEQDK